MEDSHLITDPVCPVNESVPPLAPEQTVALDATDPPTETAFTVIVAAEEFAGTGPTLNHSPVHGCLVQIEIRLRSCCICDCRPGRASVNGRLPSYYRPGLPG